MLVLVLDETSRRRGAGDGGPTGAGAVAQKPGRLSEVYYSAHCVGFH